MKFAASVIQGSGRGKNIGVPTLNLNLSDLPSELSEGIYACNVSYMLRAKNYTLAAVMHYGPRPVFNDSSSCEVHLLDVLLPSPPTTITIEIVQRLRDVQDFPSEEALKEQMRKDIVNARAILNHS